MQESSNNPAAAGGGLLQWQGDRATGLLNYSRAHGLDPNSPAANLGYLTQDLKGQYAGLAGQLRAAKTPGEAATLFSNVYERAGTPMLGNRINYANQAFGLPAVSGPPASHAPSAAAPVTTTRTNGGTVDWNAAGTAALEHALSAPINLNGHVSARSSDLLGGLARAAASQQYLAPQAPANPSAAPKPPAVRNGLSNPGAGNISPLEPATWHLGRTDMGVDANAVAPGTPIRALNNSVVDQIIPNWYAGQPLVAMKITAGPDTGKYWYVAEQIAPHGAPWHIGQTFQRGDVVATYAPSGTGIELGWASQGPSAGGTLASATGATGDASHNNAPAGVDFRKSILGG